MGTNIPKGQYATMKLSHKYYISYTFLRVYIAIAGLFPIRVNKAFSKCLLRLVYPILRSRRRVAIENLRIAFPDKSDKELGNLVYSSFENLIITFTEIFNISNMNEQQIKDYVQFENGDLLKTLYAEGKGLILLSAHYGNWEFMAMAGAYHLNFDMLIPVKLLKNWFVDRVINKNRTTCGNKVVNMDKAAIEMLKQLKNGKAIALLADQSAHENSDIFVSMFGKPTLTYKAPAELALKYGIPLTFNYCERQKDGKYIIKSELVKSDDLSYSKEGVQELTQRHSDMLEKMLKLNPSQWVWAHKRWKHSPNN